jgi:acetyl esterase
MDEPAPPLPRVEDIRIPGPAGAMPARVYDPEGVAGALRPAVAYFHGGGWVQGDLETHHGLCARLALGSGALVVSLDYRLAPEHKFPAAFDDAVAATHWVYAHAHALGIDPDRLAVGGDSAGGNLAAAVAIAFRDARGPRIATQTLIYPATDMAADARSHYTFREGYMLTRDAVLWFKDNYLRGPADEADWRCSPLRARDLSRLPPAYVITAGFDPLLDEGRAYADRLREAGVKVTYECFAGMIHGFVTMGGAIAAAHHAIYRACQGLRQAFARASG